MDENSPFARSFDAGAGDGLSEPAPDPNPAVCADGDVLPLAESDSYRVAVAYPVAIALPESGPHANALGISFPGLAESISVALTPADATALRNALTFAYLSSLSGDELPTS